jgi:hypothetical protein
MRKQSRLNNIYHMMIARCYTPTNNRYKYYGGRGIRVCNEWLETEIYPGTRRSYKGWVNFREWALNNGYEDGLTIDRIDVNKNYCPSNCRWISVKEQANNKTNNRLITYKGETKTLAQWSEELNMTDGMLRARLDKRHWSVERAFETIKNPRYINITYNGKTQSLMAWCKELNLNYKTVKSRLYQYHWTIEKALQINGKV